MAFDIETNGTYVTPRLTRYASSYTPARTLLNLSAAHRRSSENLNLDTPTRDITGNLKSFQRILQLKTMCNKRL